MRLFNRAPVIHIFLAFVIFAAVLWMPLCPSLFAADAVSTEDSADAAGLEKSNPAAAASSADLNGDGRLGIGDLGIMAASYGRTSADPDWQQHAKADLNGDGIVDIADLTSLASQ
ncbi:hypothetical protein K0U00_42515, partial [Paenibacillus sepulcri]|nr:hypothetical protein [Paenibacillus sepulcri]